MNKAHKTVSFLIFLTWFVSMVVAGSWIQDPSDTTRGSSLYPAGTPYAFYAWEGEVTNSITFSNSYERVCYLKMVSYTAYSENTLSITVGAGSNTYAVLTETCDTLLWNIDNDGIQIEKGDVLTFTASGSATNDLYYRIRR